ncbi:MAG: RDD family protein [Patescibacteria group bacterium]
MAVNNQKYAGFGIRLVAYLIDIVVIVIANVILQMIFKTINMEVLGTPASMIVGWGYLIYFTTTTGQTLGKKVMKIKVVRLSDGKTLDYLGAFLREVVGRFISGIVLGLGYLWVIGDAKKQGWHDKIAGTVVIKV